MLLRFIIKLVIFAMIAAAASFWASTRYGQGPIVNGLAKAVVPATTIGDLIQNPGKFEGSLVKVTGHAVPTLEISALGFGGFLVEDEVGSRIVVLVKSGIPPVDVAGFITVVGVYKSVLDFGAFSYPVLLAG